MKKIILLAGCFILAGCSTTNELPEVSDTRVKHVETPKVYMPVNGMSVNEFSEELIAFCVRTANITTEDRGDYKLGSFNRCLSDATTAIHKVELLKSSYPYVYEVQKIRFN